jgi:hypothetical protein
MTGKRACLIGMRRGAFMRNGFPSCDDREAEPNNRLHPTAGAGELRRAGSFNLAPAAREAER